MKHRSERNAKVTKASVKRGGAKRRRAAAKVDLTANMSPASKAVHEMRQSRPAGRALVDFAQELANHDRPLVETAGHGEIVGGEMHKLAEEIATLARKKGGKDQIQGRLAMATATARFEGEREADRSHMQNVKDIHEATTDKVVCAALAVFDEGFHNGMSPAIMISSYTLARIIDALNRAGYTAKGKR